MSDPFSVRVVIPARNAAWCIEACLAGLDLAGFAPQDIIVVDDGSTDATAAVARQSGAVVISNAVGTGAAAARNRGAHASEGDLLFFVDADVVVNPDVKARLLAFFAANPDIDAVFGAYDDAPSCQAVTSQYRNLLHHHVHMSGPVRPGSFWTGCGAVRSTTFQRVGGFDATQRMMEDVEFGMRLIANGGIVALDRTLIGKHLKSWTMFGMARTDLFDRAIPWTRLILKGQGSSGELNLGWTHRLSAVLTAMIWLSLLAAPFWPLSLVIAAVLCAGFVAVNREFLLLVRRCAGTKAALAAIPLHMLHYTCAFAGFAWVLGVEYLPHRVGTAMRPGRLSQDRTIR